MELVCGFSLVLVSLAGVYSGHSLRYYYTGVSGPGYGLPEFSAVGYLDDQQTELYTSDIGKVVPVAPWVKKERPEEWLRRTMTSKANEAIFRHELKVVMTRFHHMEGFHYGQVMHSCELRDDGSAVHLEQVRYDGEEYMYLDTRTGTFVPHKDEAEITTTRWNSPDVRAGERIRNYLGKDCIERLKRYVEYGREDLERRVHPRVKVSGRESGDTTKLHCLVYGFHPRAVDVRWMKNGVDDVPTYETKHVLPNPDGSAGGTSFIENMRQILNLAPPAVHTDKVHIQPKVKVSGRESGDVTKLHCVVYGFHPRAVDVRWMKNGMDDVPTYETTHVLPNPDGTYQIRVSVDVISNEVDTYLCYVDHSSLEEPLLVPWEPKKASDLAAIISPAVTIIIIIILLLVTGGFFVYKKNKEKYTRASTVDTSEKTKQQEAEGPSSSSPMS